VVEAATEEEKSSGGIILPDTAKQKPQEGTVVAVGSGRTLDDGSRASMAVKVGDRVVYSKYGGNEINVEGKEYLILDLDSIYAIRE
jgi:chaperonin GroES